MKSEKEIQIWGGVECTINRVGDQYFDQSEYSGHYLRGEADIDLVASLGIKMLRYPVLWERHCPRPGEAIDWSFAERCLHRMKEHNITPIAGLVHHGSGPADVNFFDGSFEEGLARYARKVAEQFPWLEYFTPVNEPLTTARFCGLYGHWYPHGKDDYSFYKVLLSECKGTVMAMAAIREVIPHAKLIGTEDLGKCYSVPELAYQRDFENHRRWLSYDLLCGRVNEAHPLWPYLTKAGITPEELHYFTEHPCVPHVAGFNYYITSERFLDTDMYKYPEHYHGGNGRHRYADIEIVKVPMTEPNGPALLLQEAYEHLQIPLAITECHLHSTREDQMRWFNMMWKTVQEVKEKGVDIRAITAWAIFGLTGWNRLCTEPGGVYEPGVFNVSSGCPRPTALARLLQELTRHKVFYHPVLEAEGWWQRSDRQQFGVRQVRSIRQKKAKPSCRPLLILGRSGTLGKALSIACRDRNIHHLIFSRPDLDLTDTAALEEVISELRPWAIINAAGYVEVDRAEAEADKCGEANCTGPARLAALCARHDVHFLTFSSDLVFDGGKGSPYTESDTPAPLNAYGRSKAAAEEQVLAAHPGALIIRTSSFFGPWDSANFVHTTLTALREGLPVTAASDVTVSPTYVPDLAHMSLDLLLDGETGIVHVTNEGALTWADLARQVAVMAGYDPALVQAVPQADLRWKARRPAYSALQSEKGIRLCTLEQALERYFEATGFGFAQRIAV
ncbi:MAG TPA: family 1 glycosylhydrolase [Chitinophagaceae bacterium]|jgi:dTDP-4-dehydrorhamnose reductase|nr:family 1 glycosylhydrolase [Chitinophagaceae bacterium]